MSSKRSATSIGEGSQGTCKKAKVDTGTIDLKKTIELLKKYESKEKRAIDVDGACPYASNATVVEQYDSTLNRTNIATNSNEFFKLQLLQIGAMYYTWKRWGRTGWSAETAIQAFRSLEEAKIDFEKTFNSLTDNEWSDKDQFTINAGKYVVIETTGHNAYQALAINKAKTTAENCRRTLPCRLDLETQHLIQMIFDEKMFNTTLKQMDINTQKMPLGQLSKHQISRGFEVLQEIEEVLTKKKKGSLKDLSSRFYTLMPYCSCVRRPTVISSKKQLRSKIEMLMALGEIETAQELQKTDPTKKEDKAVPHPFDTKYENLQCGLQLLDKSSADFKTIWKYFHASKPARNPEILNIWVLDRHSEAERYKRHDKIKNRRLLWHGTKIHAVASILKKGLRIMPSRCDQIYFASHSSYSCNFVGTNSQQSGFIFLAEVAEEYNYLNYGTNSTNNQKEDIEMELDGRRVTVPFGKLLSICHIYDKSQCRIRYLVEIKFNNAGY